MWKTAVLVNIYHKLYYNYKTQTAKSELQIPDTSLYSNPRHQNLGNELTFNLNLYWIVYVLIVEQLKFQAFLKV